MTNRQKLTEIWPIFGLSLVTPRLVLKISDGSDLSGLLSAARAIELEGGGQYQQPFMYGQSPIMERELLQRYWGKLADFKPEDWQLKFVVYLGKKVIGLQDIWAEEFAIKKTVTTGSWLNVAYQGKGLGTEMRTAALQLAFEGLGAIEAYSDYLEGNEPSLAVSRKLGYVDNGQEISKYRDERRVKRILRLDKDAWEKQRQIAVSITGLSPCLGLLGASLD